MADDRLASPREASTIAASPLSDCPRSSAIRRSRRQKASSIEMLVRWPAMTSERLTTRALTGSVGVRARKPAGVEARLGKRAFAFDQALLGLRPAEDDAVLSGCCLLALARLLLSRLAQIDDLAQSRLGHFFRNASIDTTLVSLAGSAAFSAFWTDLAGAGWGAGFADAVFAGAGAGADSGFTAAADARLAAGSGTRGSSLKPNGTDGSEKPVIESNGTTNRSGLREKWRLTSKASWVTTRSQNSCCRMIDISSGKRVLTAAGATTPGAWVLKAMLK